MDGAAITAGISTFQMNGRVLTVRAKTVEFHALVEAEIVRLRGNPLDLIVEAGMRLKEEQDASRLIDMVANAVSNRFRNWRMVTFADYGEFFDTPYGVAYQLWCCIKDSNASPPTPMEIQKWMFDRINKDESLKVRDEIQAAIDRAGSEDALGNSTGPSPAVNQVAG